MQVPTVRRLLVLAGGMFLTAFMFAGPSFADSCYGPISPFNATVTAQSQTFTLSVSANGVVGLSTTIDWDDGTSNTIGGGSGTFSHIYVPTGTYQPTLEATGTLNGQPCSTPPTVFANVTVTPCTS